MTHIVSVCLLVAGLFGAGLHNAIAGSATQSSFVRWGYPRWWGSLTGGLEIVSAVLIALPATRVVGLVLGAAIILAAVLTVVRHREFSHLVPLGVFATLMALAGTLS
ncbi:DoxX family protein [Bradyrhizobium sp. CCGUVB4N]|uniref:DoxX family protein n=1 Tax=Bradyrhizobium sp. CCGUVB4N TaxID=2949631 RepID=UPI0020B3400A|nr:DoxX family protein [Bradyrhizobium sp. CCGUVB4N]MCP3384513.1 DoxX family protein [Bradyrhizobium sp. CCGUVB4N]